MQLPTADLQRNVDTTESAGRSQADHLRSQALRCRRLAASVSDRRTATTLSLMAQDYEQKAQAQQRSG